MRAILVTISLLELRARGACHDADTDLFTSDDENLQQRGKVICETKCLIKEECLNYALAHKESWGVWGGTTATDRKNLLKIRHRVRCPNCRSTEVEQKGRSEICIKCGLSWLV